MGRLVLSWVCVCALVAVAVGGCSEESAGVSGSGGSGGMGGTGGDGGTSVCPPGICMGVDCDDGDPCTTDACDLTDGTCSHAVACDDFNDCTTQMCDPADGLCSTATPVADGTSCAGGTCQSGTCVLSASVLPCTEQGIRNAIAAGDATYTLACDGATAVVTKAEIEIDHDVVLDGEGKLTVDGNCGHRVFSVPEGVVTELRRLTVTRGGGVVTLGGAIGNVGTLSLISVTVSDSRLYHQGRWGGGIGNTGTLVLANSTVSGNDATEGFGIENDGTMTVTNSTVSGNMGGIINAGTLTVMSSTVVGNTYNDIVSFVNGTVTLTNSLVGNCGTDRPATITSLGYNIESPLDTCGFDQTTDQVDVTPEELNIGPLQDNGGPTMTHALLQGSVAIDVIPADMCEGDTDQRGEPRPGGTTCDVGAFEVQEGSL